MMLSDQLSKEILKSLACAMICHDADQIRSMCHSLTIETIFISF